MAGHTRSAMRNLVIVADATGSMGEFLSSIAASMKQFISVMNLTGGFDRVRLLAYYDYCDSPVTRSTPWGTTLEDFEGFMQDLEPDGGGDWPEAAKTAANEVIGWLKPQSLTGQQPEAVNAGKPVNDVTTVIWYADAPPHHLETKGGNYMKEKAALGERADWVRLSKELAECGAAVYPIINTHHFETASFYALMAIITGGQALYIQFTSPQNITKVTVSLVLGVMGCECDWSETTAELITFKNQPVIGNIHDENQGSLGYLVGCSEHPQKELSCVQPVVVLRVDLLWTDLTLAGRRFDADSAYRDMVYREFERLVTPDAVMALTYNSVFGALWRAICRRRKDERTERLLRALDDVLRVLQEGMSQRLRAWLEASYDNVAEVKARLGEHIGPAFPAFMLDRPVHMGAAPTTQELLELARSCHPSVLTRVSSLLTCLRIQNDGQVGMPTGPAVEREQEQAADKETSEEESALFVPEYLPLSLPNQELFSLLPHLLSPGTVFSRRPAIILACLAVLQNADVLAERAREYLADNCGKWFDLEQPENYSMDLARIMIQVQEQLQSTGHPPALTLDEHKFFALMARLGGLTINARTSLLLTQACTPFKLLRLDRKHTCRQCLTPRSFTLMTPSGVCGLCLTDSSLSPEGTPIPEPHPDRSHWCECRTCLGHYAVVRIDLLNTNPKCHYCRHDLPPPLRQCSVCTNKYVDPCLEEPSVNGSSQPVLNSATAWVCPACEADPKSSFTSESVELRHLVAAQPDQLLSQLLGLDVPKGADIYGNGSLFKLVTVVGVKWLAGRDGCSQVACQSTVVHDSHDEARTPTDGMNPSQPSAADGPHPAQSLSASDTHLAQPPAANAMGDMQPVAMPHSGDAQPGISAGGDAVKSASAGKVDSTLQDIAKGVEVEDRDVVAADAAGVSVPDLQFKGKPVLNAAEVCAQILNWVGSGKAERGNCMLCYEDVSKKQLHRSCGARGNCPAVACADCLSSWYGVPKPGHVISRANFMCPFCKCPADTKTLQRFNKLVCAIKGRTHSDFLADPSWLYAWCSGCYYAKQCMPRTCAVDMDQLPTGFQCEECEVATAHVLKETKTCPGCGHGVVKLSGCDHITCVCGEHWCWRCGEGGFTMHNIYGHIDSHHE